MTTYCIANWKMNGSLVWIHDYVYNFCAGDAITKCHDKDVVTVLCPPHPYIAFTSSCAVGKPLAIGAQDCTHHDNQASTSEVTASMVADCGATYVIVGHSEYRQNHSPTDDGLAAKLCQGIAADIRPVFCIGESLADYEAGVTHEVLSQQCQVLGLVKDAGASLDTLIIAYEPLWAIGSGKTPTVSEIQETCAAIHAHVVETYGVEIPILYGGSVKPANAAEILSLSAVDGVLVGGASLDPASFRDICTAALG